METVAGRLGPALDRLAGGAFARRAFTLELWDGSVLPASVREDGGPPPRVLVRSRRAVAELLRHPDELGLARAWVRGDLDVDGDVEAALAATLRFRGVHLGLRDRLRALMLAARAGVVPLRPLPSPASEAHLRGARHSSSRDGEAVRHHYELPTAFYRLLLGPSMVYSCAYFAADDEPLEVAQERKLDLVCRKLDLRPGERLLDIGCGWGSLLLHAAERYGVRAVGITRSREQAREARRRVREAGLADCVEVRVQDYREVVDGPFDKLASVGMVEHVGTALLETYAHRLAALARPGGRVLNHGIVRLTPRPDSDRTFIARYVFPDGELQPLHVVLRALERGGLEVRDVEALREHYPLTLRAWSANLARERDEAIAHAGTERERIWRLYLAGAALAFERGEIGVCQTLAVRPGAPHGLPLVRPWHERAGRRVPVAA